MATAEVKLVFRINVELVSDFITRMQDLGESLADGYRCPAVFDGEDLRCELMRDHGDKHVHDRFSWELSPATVAER